MVFRFRISTYAVILTAYRTGSNRQSVNRRDRTRRLKWPPCKTGGGVNGRWGPGSGPGRPGWLPTPAPPAPGLHITPPPGSSLMTSLRCATGCGPLAVWASRNVAPVEGSPTRGSRHRGGA